MSGMHEYFEGIAWWLNQRRGPLRDVSMGDLADGLKSYNEYRKEHAESHGKEVRMIPAGRATLYRKFMSIEDALARTQKYLVDEGRTVPKNLDQYLAVSTKASSRDQHVRVFNNDASIEEIQQWIDRAEAAKDDLQVVSLREHLAARMLRDADKMGDEEKVECLKKAFEAAKKGYAVAAESPSPSKRLRHDQMLCARSAAWAAVQLSRLSIGQSSEAESDRYLMFSSIWKRHEAERAKDLNLPLTAEVALFHANRATALIEDDLDRTVIGLRDISRYLITRAGGQGSSVNDRVRYHDLTSIIQRLCALDWAASKDARCQMLVRTHFSDGIGHTIDQLKGLYDNEGRGSEGRQDVEVLLLVKEMNDALLNAYEEARSSRDPALIEGIDDVQIRVPHAAALFDIINGIGPWHLLRIQEHKTLHTVALTRYALAVYDIHAQGREEKSTLPGLEHLPPAEQLLATAGHLCQMAHSSTRPRTVDAVLLNRVDLARSEIEERLSAARWKKILRDRAGTSFYDHAIHELRALLWKSVTSDPITYKDAEELSRIVGTIGRYLRESGTGMQVGIDPSLA